MVKNTMTNKDKYFFGGLALTDPSGNVVLRTVIKPRFMTAHEAMRLIELFDTVEIDTDYVDAEKEKEEE
jgi:hypothetical protein